MTPIEETLLQYVEQIKDGPQSKYTFIPAGDFTLVYFTVSLDEFPQCEENIMKVYLDHKYNLIEDVEYVILWENDAWTVRELRGDGSFGQKPEIHQ